MIIFFAGAESSIYRNLLHKSEYKPSGVLFSQFYGNKEPTETFKEFHDKGTKVFIDSGGFSARIKGVDLKVEDYADFLEKHEGAWDYCANLDVNDPDESLENQEYLEERGFTPLPVFHYSEIELGREDLIKYYCDNYDYIALGGVAATVKDAKKKKNYFNFCFHHAVKTETKMHGFGVTDEESLTTYPWFSVDSTAWLSGTKFSKVYKYDKGRLTYFSTSKKVDIDTKELFSLDNPLRLVDRGESQYKERCLENIKAIRQYEDYITRLWEKRGVTWEY